MGKDRYERTDNAAVPPPDRAPSGRLAPLLTGQGPAGRPTEQPSAAENRAQRSDTALHRPPAYGPPLEPPEPPTPAEEAAGRSDRDLHAQNRSLAPPPISTDHPAARAPEQPPYPVLAADRNSSGVVVSSDRLAQFKAHERVFEALENIPPNVVSGLIDSLTRWAASEEPQHQHAVRDFSFALGRALQSRAGARPPEAYNSRPETRSAPAAGSR